MACVITADAFDTLEGYVLIFHFHIPIPTSGILIAGSWKSWRKEGFARYIENKIRRKLELPENHYGADEPFNRIVFCIILQASCWSPEKLYIP